MFFHIVNNAQFLFSANIQGDVRRKFLKCDTDTDIILRTYSGESIAPLRMCTVTVDLNDQKQNFNLYVLRKGGPLLFGQEWLRNMKLNWAEIKAVETLKKSADGFLDTYRRIFSDELGTLEGINARIKVRESATPKFCNLKARTIPFALRPKVDKKLDRLVKIRIHSKVEHSE